MKQPTDTRKAFVALAILILSLGALTWQVLVYRHHEAMTEAASKPMEWRVATEQERHAALSSIKNQLDAFKRDDYEAAMKYQSNGLRQNFPSAKVFRHMITNGYPQFAHYKSVTFGSEQIDTSGKFFEVPVIVVDSHGVKADALYDLIMEEGLWRVNGVQGGTAPPAKKSASKI
jgi:hypothetical protein